MGGNANLCKEESWACVFMSWLPALDFDDSHHPQGMNYFIFISRRALPSHRAGRTCVRSPGGRRPRPQMGTWDPGRSLGAHEVQELIGLRARNRTRPSWLPRRAVNNHSHRSCGLSAYQFLWYVKITKVLFLTNVFCHGYHSVFTWVTLGYIYFVIDCPHGP